MDRSGKRSLAIPLAILCGSAIVAIGLFAGLRTTGAVSPMANPPTVPSTVVDTGRTFAQAQAALDALQPQLAERCWTESGAGEPSSIVVTYDVTFKADGSIYALGISESREAYRADVATCLRRLSRPVLPVDPPGSTVGVTLQLALP